MANASIPLVSQINRVPSMTVELTGEDEKKYQEIMEICKTVVFYAKHCF